MSSDVVKPEAILSEDQLADMRSFEDALAILASAGIPVTSSTDYGDGFSVHPKDEFVNRKFILVDYKIVDGEKSDYGSEFAVIRLVTVDGVKAIITDGSTGIRDQILRLRRNGVTGGITCERGLTVSEYFYEDEKGNKKPAKTFYIDGM